MKKGSKINYMLLGYIIKRAQLDDKVDLQKLRAQFESQYPIARQGRVLPEDPSFANALFDSLWQGNIAGAGASLLGQGALRALSLAGITLPAATILGPIAMAAGLAPTAMNLGQYFGRRGVPGASAQETEEALKNQAFGRWLRSQRHPDPESIFEPGKILEQIGLKSRSPL